MAIGYLDEYLFAIELYKIDRNLSMECSSVARQRLCVPEILVQNPAGLLSQIQNRNIEFTRIMQAYD